MLTDPFDALAIFFIVVGLGVLSARNQLRTVPGVTRIRNAKLRGPPKSLTNFLSFTRSPFPRHNL